MDSNTNPKAAALIPLLVVGIALNTIGIALQGLGNARFVMMGAGCLLMLVAVVRMVKLRDEDKPSDPK